MGKQFKAKDVFKANAVTKADLDGAIVGRYVPTGPNKWDDLEFERDDTPENHTVPADSRIQVEPIGALPEVLFRVRSGRKVLILRWKLTDEDQEQVDSGKWGVQEAEKATFIEKVLGMAPKNDPRDDMHEYFLDVKADPIS